jgi:uncharacterized membrane protein
MPALEILAEAMPMGFCAKFGGTVSDNSTFCAGCSPPAVGVPVYEPPRAPVSANVAGALACLFGVISGFIFLRVEPYNRNPFVRFHAYQSIYLNVFVIVLIVALASFGTSTMFLWGVMTLVRFLGESGVLHSVRLCDV